MKGTAIWTCDMQRPGWSVRTISISRISCTDRDWLIGASVTAYEAEKQVFEKIFEKSIPRDLM